MDQEEERRPMLERLLREHDAIRALAARLEELLTQESVPDIEAVASARWEMTKAIVAHNAFEDRHVNLPLERDSRPHAATIAKRFKAELEAIQDGFEGHMEKWSSAATLADWGNYRRTATARTRTLLDRMQREESELFPLIAGNEEITRGATPPPPERNWARSAWSVQSSLAKR